MYLFWFTVGVPFILKSGTVFGGPALLFMLSFFAAIIGEKIKFAVISRHFREFLDGRWYRHIMKFLRLGLISYALLLFKELPVIIGVV